MHYVDDYIGINCNIEYVKSDKGISAPFFNGKLIGYHQ